MYEFISGFNLPKLLDYNFLGNLCRPAFGVKKSLQLDAYSGVISTERSDEISISQHL